MSTRRRAALSAAGLFLIAGCSGGGHALAPSPSGGNGNSLGPSSSLTNPAKVTLSLTVPARQTQVSKRGAASYHPTSVRRVPTWVSPSTAYVGIQEMYGGQQAYFTYLALSSCTASSGTYQCATNLQAGTFTIYTNLYDQNIYLLSTNIYSSPAPTTIYPNGSSYPNNIYITTAGVISNLEEASPSFCFAAGVQQSIPLYVLDADGNTIVGPIANPITPTFTAYDGAGFGAISLYVMYNGSPLAANNGLPLTDTSLFSSPYFFVSGQEGAIYVAGTLQNIPAYSNGSLSYTASGGYAATGTYIAWGIDNNPQQDGMYPIAIQQSLNQAVTCQSANGTNDAFIEVESFLDPVTGMPYLVTGDAYNNIAIFDAYSTADAAHAYTFFQTSNAYGNIGPKSQLYQTYAFSPSNAFVNVLTSSVWQGRVDLVSSATIDYDDTSNGAIYSDGAYGPSSVLMNSSTRFAGNPGKSVLYYNDVGTPFIYGFNTSSPPGSALAPIDFSSGYPITGQIYSVSPSGASGPLIEVRGANSAGAFFVCAFSAASFTGSVSCSAIASTDANPVSTQYDPGTGHIMWAGGSTAAFAFPASTVSASQFVMNVGTFSSTYQIYTLAHGANRILSGLEGVPGVAGFYGGPQASGPCNGTGEVTWLRYTGTPTWTYLASMCWPNHYLTLTYP
jgi:hypothetical protein